MTTRPIDPVAWMATAEDRTTLGCRYRRVAFKMMVRKGFETKPGLWRSHFAPCVVYTAETPEATITANLWTEVQRVARDCLEREGE